MGKNLIEFEKVEKKLLENRKKYEECKLCIANIFCGFCIGLEYQENNKINPYSKEFCNAQREISKEIGRVILDIYSDSKNIRN